MTPQRLPPVRYRGLSASLVTEAHCVNEIALTADGWRHHCVPETCFRPEHPVGQHIERRELRVHGCREIDVHVTRLPRLSYVPVVSRA